MTATIQKDLIRSYLPLILLMACCMGCSDITELGESKSQINYPNISGIYPHLAMYNSQGECGTGAVVPWANRIWVITYSPHFPNGSDDGLYEITASLDQHRRSESLGGTPANRMIHRESNQLFIGPYAITHTGEVKSIPYKNMPGRHTGNARHLSDPDKKIYYASMEEGFYEVDVNDLSVDILYRDGHDEEGKRLDYGPSNTNPEYANLAGAHGKGLYSGQGVLVYSNNGETSSEAMRRFDIESGALAEWDGKHWKLVRRNQFVEVTGPGGIYGNVNPDTDPIWATGWDHKSLLLGVRNPTVGWRFFRLPKASHSYDGAHGWNTEWPRIRNIGSPEQPDYLMTMHGMFWRFPGHFSHENSNGIRPRSAYLKVIGDFARWQDRLVFGCDDSAQREFLNKRKHKGNIEGPGQSNSNLWFTSLDRPDQLGPKHASGAVWLEDDIRLGEHSEPFLFAGWSERSCWIANHSDQDITLTFEVDVDGKNQWTKLQENQIRPGANIFIPFSESVTGEWIRVYSDLDAKISVSFHYADQDSRVTTPAALFNGLASCQASDVLGGLLYGLGENRRTLGISGVNFENGKGLVHNYYELTADLKLSIVEDPETLAFINDKFAIPQHVVDVQESSVLIIDDDGRRWRLPKGDSDFTELTSKAHLRICREVATERDLFNCHGTFYELPAENADGFAKIRPISSHPFRIHDYASYRGLIVLTGISVEPAENEHIIRSDDGQAAVWVGVIDDLWQMGKPRGQGGPWLEDAAKAGVPSDPYLFGFYDQRTLRLSHDRTSMVNFTIEVDPNGHGPWMAYKNLEVEPGEGLSFSFPESFEARWIRFRTDQDCVATAQLIYN